jgi:hypothetical protein
MSTPDLIQPKSSNNQVTDNHGFEVEQIPNCGRGIVASRDFQPGEEIMFVKKPLVFWLFREALERMSISLYHFIQTLTKRCRHLLPVPPSGQTLH